MTNVVPPTSAPSGHAAPAQAGERGPESLTLGDADPEIADLQQIYLDGTLVLVGCGAAKRDPDDPTDRHLASVPAGEPVTKHGTETGPAWRAEDLYTSAYFRAKREFAEVVTQWARRREHNPAPWAILSAQHRILRPWEDVTPYDTTIDDLGDDPSDPDQWYPGADEGRPPHPPRRPSGGEIVTEMDYWAAHVALDLEQWIASYREPGVGQEVKPVNTLLVLAGQSYLDPLRERGVFEYGGKFLTRSPNDRPKLSERVTTRFLFDEIDAGGIGEQMAWLSDAVDRLVEAQTDPTGAGTDQAAIAQWSGSDPRACAECGVGADAADGELVVYEPTATVYCEAHKPIGECARCETPTHHRSKFGKYPLCPDCRSHRGGMTDENLPDETPGEQADLPGVSE